VFPVCGNTWKMLKETRFSPYFEFIGDFSRHYGIFSGCGTTIPFDTGMNSVAASGTCC
jgi:arsenite methyltransferase